MKKSIYYIIILLVTIFPYSVNADWCSDVGTGATCYPLAGTIVYCVTPTLDPIAPTSYSYLTGGAWYDALEKMGGVSPGNINALRASWAFFSAKLNEGDIETSDSSNCSNSNINTTVELTEIPYDKDDEDTIINSKEDYKFVRRFNLSVSATSDDGDLNDFTFALNVSINGNKSFKLKGDFSKVDISNQIRSGGTYKNVLTVYSKDLIVDASNFTLTAKVTPKTTCSKYILAGTEGQWYIGQISNQTSNIKVESDSITVPVSNSCQYTTEINEKTGNEEPVYRLQIVRPGSDNSENQTVDVLTYMKKGCCSTVQPKFFNKNTEEGKAALLYYIDNCLDKDVVSYENNCGTNDCSGGQNVDSYSYSFVWQASINKLKKAYNLDKLNASDINSEYKDGIFKHYFDTNLSNKYCKVLTSERNDIYFPTTAVATSGRFFVFQALDSDECKKLVGSTTCFRQPRVEGVIDLYVKTNLKAYNDDIENVEKRIKEACNGSSLEQLAECTEAKKERADIEELAEACEDNINNFDYKLEPTITFSYTQEYYDGSKQETSTKTVNMVSNDEEVKYWPYITTKTEGENKTYQFDKDGVYEAKYTKTVYYRPESYTYSLLPSGTVATTNEFQDTTTRFEKGIGIGYVFNIKTTTYVGIYDTWFDISNLGNGGKDSLLNRYTIEEYKAASKRDYNNDESIMFESKCKYCVEEGAFQRECDTCDESDPKFVFRNVSLSNITPNTEEGDRKNEGTNWVDDKGNAAKSDIESASGNGIAVADIKDSDKELLNNNTLESNEKSNIVFTANEGNTNYIYANDEKYLEYDITLTSVDMRKIRENNKNISYDYAEINVCNELSTTSVTKDDSEYCYTCNKDGKECESSFITAYTDNDGKAPGRKKWKYYFYNPDNPEESTFITGTMASGKVLAALKKIQGNEDGGYPDPENQEGWLNTYKNWP